MLSIPQMQEKKIRGASKLQAMVRRRQSRGIFRGVIMRSEETPDMNSYADAKPAAMAAAAAKGHELAANRSTAARFDGPGSHFHKPDGPEAGDYNPQRPVDVVINRSLQKPSAMFQAAANRFNSHDSHYAISDAPAVGTYQTEQSLDDRSMKSSKHIASFAANHIDRFGGHESHFKMSEAPGVGAYDTTALKCKDPVSMSKMSSTMASNTNRFSSHDSHFKVSQAPAVGLYTPNDDVRIKGATKLQRSIRRRQSRGIFASMEARARNMPDMYSYVDAKPAAMAAAAAKGHELAANRSTAARFDGPGSHFHKPDGPEAGDYNPQNPLALSVGTAVASAASKFSAHTLSRLSRFEDLGSIYGRGSISRVESVAPGVGCAASRLLSTAFVLERLSVSGVDERMPKDDLYQSRTESPQLAASLPSLPKQMDSFERAEDEAKAFAALQEAVEKAPVDLESVAKEAEV